MRTIVTLHTHGKAVIILLINQRELKRTVTRHDEESPRVLHRAFPHLPRLLQNSRPTLSLFQLEEFSVGFSKNHMMMRVGPILKVLRWLYFLYTIVMIINLITLSLFEIIRDTGMRS